MPTEDAGRRAAPAALGRLFCELRALRCSRKAEVDGAIAAGVEEFGRIDILVANAGIVHAAEFLISARPTSTA
jgi:NAD(P)-dependent dehydrogenase (short-subunit alcohol dehydrogenase family)